MDCPHQKKSGRFCSQKSKKKYSSVADAMNKRWSTQIDEQSLDIVNHDHKYQKHTGEI